MHKVKGVQDLNANELKSRVAGTSASWHEQYRHSAYIYVGGLDYNLTEGDIICIFSQFGEIMDLNMVRDKATGKAKGFCFIAYEDQRSTDLAVDNFNGAKVCGKTLSVDHVGKYRGPKPPGSDEDEPEEKVSVAPADFVKLEKEKKRAKKAEKAALKEEKAMQKQAKALAKEIKRAEKAQKKAAKHSGKKRELPEQLGVTEEEQQAILARRAKLLDTSTRTDESGSESDIDPMEMMKKEALKANNKYERTDINTGKVEQTATESEDSRRRRSRSRDGRSSERLGAKSDKTRRSNDRTEREGREPFERDGGGSSVRDRKRADGDRSRDTDRYRSRQRSRSRSRGRDRGGSRRDRGRSTERSSGRDQGRDRRRSSRSRSRSRDRDHRRDSERVRRRERSRSADRRSRTYR